MDRMQLVPSLTQNRLEAVIDMHRNGQAIGRAVFDASGLQSVIHDFTKVRAAMAESVPDELDPGSRIDGVPNPCWRMDVQNDGGILLSFRHPGFGWVAFKLPKHEATHLAEQILIEKPKGQSVTTYRL